MIKQKKEEVKLSHEDYKNNPGLPYMDLDIFEGTSSEIIERLNRIDTVVGHEVSYEWDYYGYDGGRELVAYYMRDETEEEKLRRQRRERSRAKEKRKQQEITEKRERTLLETLKKKYEDK